MSYDVSVNTYQNQKEIYEIEGFSVNEGVGKKNFKELIGDYSFPKSTYPLKCCFLKPNGNLCAQDHWLGYVVELNDGKRSLLGSSCVKKFDKDGNVRKSISRYDNAKRHHDRISYINHSFYVKQRTIAELEDRQDKLECLQQYYENMKPHLPPRALKSLEDMARIGKDSVTVVLITITEYIDEEDGKTKQERREIIHTVGRVLGIKIFSENSWRGLLDKVATKIRFCRSLEYTKHDTGPRITTKLYSELQGIDQLLKEVDDMHSEKLHFEHSDKDALCYLSHEAKDRIRLLKMSLLDKGRQKDCLYASKILSEMDDKHKLAYSAHVLKIP